MIQIWFRDDKGNKECLEYPEGLWTIGRDPECDICLDVTTVSNRHATLSHINGQWMLSDLNSTNGTLVNGLIIEKTFLKNGDVLHFGAFTCWVAGIPQESAQPKLI